MKNLVIGSMILIVSLLLKNYNKFNEIDKIYAFLFCIIPLVYIKNPKTILTIHMIYSFVVCTYGMMCTHKYLLLSGLICTALWFYSTYVYKTCYFLELQYNDRNIESGMFKHDKFKIGYLFFLYNNLLGIMKLFNLYRKNNIMENINKIITGIIGYVMIHDLLVVHKLNYNKPLLLTSLAFRNI